MQVLINLMNRPTNGGPLRVGGAGEIVADNRSSILVTGGFEGGIHVRGPDTEQDFVSSLGNALSLVGKLQVNLNAPHVERGAVMGGGGQSFQPEQFLSLSWSE